MGGKTKLCKKTKKGHKNFIIILFSK